MIMRIFSDSSRSPLALCLLTVIGGLWPASSVTAGDWPQWLGPNRNGVSSETVAPWEGEPKVLWKHPAGNGFNVPVVANDVVYIHAAVLGKDAEQVTAYDLHTGEQKWHQTYPRARYSSQLGVGPRATPTVHGDKLVTFGINGELACFNAGNGDILWRINPYKDNEITLPNFGICSSPLVYGKHVYVQIGGEGMAVAAYELETGKLAWKGLDEPASSASPIVWEHGEGDARRADIVVQTTLRIVGLDPETSQIRWEHPLVFQPQGVSPTPVVAGNQLVCTTQSTGALAVTIPPAEGETKSTWWNQEFTSYFSTGTVGSEGKFFLITNATMPLPQTDVRCLDVATGKELWKQDKLGYFHVGLIALANDHLLILSDGGILTLAKVDGEGFEQLCQTKVCGGTFANPVLSNGHLILRDDQHLLCLELKAAP